MTTSPPGPSRPGVARHFTSALCAASWRSTVHDDHSERPGRYSGTRERSSATGYSDLRALLAEIARDGRQNRDAAIAVARALEVHSGQLRALNDRLSREASASSQADLSLVQELTRVNRELGALSAQVSTLANQIARLVRLHDADGEATAPPPSGEGAVAGAPHIPPPRPVTLPPSPGAFDLTRRR